MKHKLTAIVITLYFTSFTFAQNVGIGTATPNSSAMLDISSNNKGLLIPRLTTNQRINIETLVNSLLVFDINTGSYWYYKGNKWEEIATGSNSSDSTLIYGQQTGTLSSNNMSNGTYYFDSSGYLFDSGGPAGNYGNNENFTVTIIPVIGAIALRVQVISNNLENPYDTLFIQSTDPNAPVDTLTGTEVTSRYFDAYSDFGAIIHFKSNAVNTTAGFKIKWDNIYLPVNTSNTILPLTGWHYDPAKIAMHGGININNNWSKDSSGLFSLNYGYSNKAKGDFSVAMGFGSNAAGNSSIAMGRSTASNAFSSAMGYSIASGVLSTALGNSIASGNYSTALGNSTALAEASTAIGKSTASGFHSTAIGESTTAKAGFETVFGRWNTDYTPASSTDWIETDRLLTIGNGTAIGSRRDAMVILKNGNTGIGTSNPKAAFNVATNKTVLFGNDTSGSGSKLIWYPSKSALRAGLVDLDYWDYNNVGYGSVAFGYGTKASGPYSSSWGLFNIATGDVSIAMGNQNTATGFNSTSLGFGTTAIGDHSTTIGINTTAKSFGEIVIGAYNTDYTPLSNTNWNSSDRLFVIGNGTFGNKSNALVILKNGNIGIGESNPAFPLNFYGSLGDKISLYGNAANGSSIGFGIQSGLLQIHSYQASDAIAFGYGSSSSFTEQMRIKGNGNVGIGTNDPNAPLQFANTLVNRKIVMWETANNDHQYSGFGVNGNVVRYQSDNPNADHVFYSAINSTSSKELVRIKGNGNVGIGTATPAAKLDVNGYSKLGELSPNIKTVLLIGTTASTQGGTAGVTTGIAESKILSVSIFVSQASDFIVPPMFTNAPGYEYQYTISGGILALFNKSANSVSILSKPFTAFITYKE